MKFASCLSLLWNNTLPQLILAGYDSKGADAFSKNIKEGGRS